MTLNPADPAFEAALPTDWQMVNSSGHCSYYAAQMPSRPQHRFLTIREFGAIGNGLSFALGVAAACPDDRVVLFDGDGSLLMHVQELETVLRHELDILIVVLNDGAYGSEIHKLRAEGLPILSAEEVAEADEVLRIERLVTEDGEPLPEEEWPNVPGVRVHVVKEWVYPEDEYDEEHEDDSDEEHEDDEPAEPYQQYVPVWVVTDLAASGLRRRGGGSSSTASADEGGESEEEAEARREERRRVIANNKAWASAETVRREWLTGFVARKTAPKGAEALICEAVVTGHHSLSKAMDHRHPMLFTLLGIDVPTGYYGAGHDECHKIATKASAPKAATMTTLAAVVAAWEATTGKHSWRNPTAWDARVLGALVEWGYQPSEVERILLGEEPQPSTETDGDDNAGEASDSAA